MQQSVTGCISEQCNALLKVNFVLEYLFFLFGVKFSLISDIWTFSVQWTKWSQWSIRCISVIKCRSCTHVSDNMAHLIRIILDTGMIIFNVILQVVFSVNLSLQRSHLIMHTCARQYGTLSHTQSGLLRHNFSFSFKVTNIQCIGHSLWCSEKLIAVQYNWSSIALHCNSMHNSGVRTIATKCSTLRYKVDCYALLWVCTEQSTLHCNVDTQWVARSIKVHNMLYVAMHSNQLCIVGR